MRYMIGTMAHALGDEIFVVEVSVCGFLIFAGAESRRHIAVVSIEPCEKNTKIWKN